MKLYMSCQVLVLGAVLSSAACMGQTAATPSLPAPSVAIESGDAVIDTSYCPAISAGDSRLALISRLCEFALTYRHQLPDFVAQQTTTAHEGFSTNVIAAQVSFRQDQEHYSHVTINGKPVPSSSIFGRPPKNIRFSSTGEFGSLLVDLFASPGVSQFKFRKEAVLRGIRVAIYDFRVPAGQNTFWSLRDAKGRVLKPEFCGQLWVEQQTGHPLREEVEPINLPVSSGAASIKTVTDYAMTSIGDAGTFLLPVRSESTVCFWAPYAPCATNIVVFHDYRKFAATTRILAASPEP